MDVFVVTIHVIWQGPPSLPQFLHAVPALLGDISKYGNCFFVSGLGAVWVCRLKVAVRGGINGLDRKALLWSGSRENLASLFCVLYGVLTGAT